MMSYPKIEDIAIFVEDRYVNGGTTLVLGSVVLGWPNYTYEIKYGNKLIGSRTFNSVTSMVGQIDP